MVTTPPQQFCVRWNSYQSNLQNAFPKLLTSEHFVDVTLACESEMLKCHKVVLSACSMYFEKLLLDNPCQHPIIFMKDMKFQEMQSLVDFMYKGEVNVTQDDLPSLLKSAEALQIRGLCGSDQLLNQQQFGGNGTLNSKPPQPSQFTGGGGGTLKIQPPQQQQQLLSPAQLLQQHLPQLPLSQPLIKSSTIQSTTSSSSSTTTATNSLDPASKTMIHNDNNVLLKSEASIKKEDKIETATHGGAGSESGNNPSSSECDSNDGLMHPHNKGEQCEGERTARWVL